MGTCLVWSEMLERMRPERPHHQFTTYAEFVGVVTRTREFRQPGANCVRRRNSGGCGGFSATWNLQKRSAMVKMSDDSLLIVTFLPGHESQAEKTAHHSSHHTGRNIPSDGGDKQGRLKKPVARLTFRAPIQPIHEIFYRHSRPR